MKNSLILLLLFTPIAIFGSPFSSIYSVGKEFYFNYSISKDGMAYSILPKKHESPGMQAIPRNSFEEYVLPSTTDTLFIDTLMISVQALLVRKKNKTKSISLPILWFTGVNYQRDFGKIQLSDTKTHLKIFPMDETWIETGFMNSIQASPSLMISTSPTVHATWTDSFDISNTFVNEKWTTWKERLNVISTYQIVGKDSIQTALGKLECWKIHAKSESEIGKSSLETYFCAAYGFVVLDYILVDGTRLRLELIGVGENSD